jgi:hypothetical protein
MVEGGGEGVAWPVDIEFLADLRDIQTNILGTVLRQGVLHQELAVRSPTVAKAVKAIVGKRLDELENPAAKAMWIRTYNEAKEDRTFNVALTSGTFGGKMRTANGGYDHASSLWSSMGIRTNSLSTCFTRSGLTPTIVW